MCRVKRLWDDTSLWRWAVQSQAFSCDGDTDRRQSHGFTESCWRYLRVTRGLSLTRQHCVPGAHFPWTKSWAAQLPKDSKTADGERWDIYLWKGPSGENVWDKRATCDYSSNSTIITSCYSSCLSFYVLSTSFSDTFIFFFTLSVHLAVIFLTVNLVLLVFPGFQPE